MPNTNSVMRTEVIDDQSAAALAPDGAKVLTLEQAQAASVTPREINAHLERILQSYDDLTARYAQNKRAIDAELASLKQSGGEVSSQILQLHAALQQQNGALVSHVATTEDGINAVKSRLQTSVALIHNRVDADVKRLGEGIGSLDDMLAAQAGIVREQNARLNQFDVTYALLDTAVRGSRKRIEEVREETEKQHAIVAAQVQGLDALQRAHYAEFDQVRQTVGVLKAESLRLGDAIRTVSTNLAAHVQDTRRTFKRTHLALAALVLVTVSGFALVKWVPAFAPVSTEKAMAQSDLRIKALDAQVATLPVLQAMSEAQGERVDQEAGRVDVLARNVSGLQKSLHELRGMVVSASVQSGAVLPSGRSLRDSQWLLQQNPKAFTVQLLGAGSGKEMQAYIAQYATALDGDKALSFTVTQRDQHERFNLFYGVFDNVDQALAAVESMPTELRAHKPWVRKIGAVQNSVQ